MFHLKQQCLDLVLKSGDYKESENFLLETRYESRRSSHPKRVEYKGQKYPVHDFCNYLYNPRVVLLGNGLSGKTFLMKNLEFDNATYAKQENNPR
jgi:hypothetical protein